MRFMQIESVLQTINRSEPAKNRFSVALLQTILKAPVKFQKDWPKTVGGVEGTRYLLPIHFCSIRVKKCLS